MAKITKVELTYEDLENILVTALEGGSNYWYLLHDEDIPQEPADEAASVRITKKAWEGKHWKLRVYDRENPDELLGVFSRFKLEKHIADEEWALNELLTDNLDASSADALFQLGTMGKLVFG